MNIHTVEDLSACLDNGPYAWPGGYPVYFIAADGAALSFDAVEAERETIEAAIKNSDDAQWRVVACEINWEDAELFCDHTGERIHSAYAEPDDSEI